jgi:DNA-binding XRE family transcriptional regulator
MGSKKKACESHGERVRGSNSVERKNRQDRNRLDKGGSTDLFSKQGGIARLEPQTLPSVFFEWKAALPKCAGIYFVIDNNEEVLYIGRSKDINQRWSSVGHHRHNQLSSMSGVRIAWMEVTDLLLLPDIESALIDWFCPVLNRLAIGKPRLQKPRLGILREQAGLTQRQLAKQLGVTDQTVSNWENGISTLKLTPRQTINLCQSLNRTLEELAEEIGDELKEEDSCNL